MTPLMVAYSKTMRAPGPSGQPESVVHPILFNDLRDLLPLSSSSSLDNGTVYRISVLLLPLCSKSVKRPFGTLWWAEYRRLGGK